VLNEKAGLLQPTRLVDKLGKAELSYLCLENASPAADFIENELMRDITACSIARFMDQPFVQEHDSPITTMSDLTRLPAMVYICRAFGADENAKERRKLLEMDSATLKKLKHQMDTEPWFLCWPAYMKQHYGKLKCMKRKGYYFLQMMEIPAVVVSAMSLYFEVLDAQEERGHTIFSKESFFQYLPMMPLEQRKLLEEQIYDFLMEYALSWVDEKKGLFALRPHYEDSLITLSLLHDVVKRARDEPEPDRRGHRVPHKYLPLTPDQERIAMHIRTHAITIVEGKPGTGKTAEIEFVFAHYYAVMLSTFVGMMAKSLQKRNGERREIAHTIHRLIHMSKSPVGAEWLGKYQVLVVDEFSNVSQHLLRRLLEVMTNVRRIVFVGDHAQLKPIDAGDPMGDLKRHLGSQMLTENLRVKPHLKTLQEAPGLILEERWKEISHGPRLPITCIGRPKSLTDLVRSLGHPKLMQFHVVVLVNEGADGRNHVNQLVESAWLELGVIRKTNVVDIRRNCQIYPGCKITFLQNYNTPLLEKVGGQEIRSDPVANGELGIVISIDKLFDGWKVVFRDSDEVDAEQKVVWVRKNVLDDRGVSAHHIDLGYATTTYKTQGREFLWVLFWTPPADRYICMTRAHAYVGISRAQEKCWIAGEWGDFLDICSRPDLPRRTCFNIMLKQRPLQVKLTHYTPAPIIPLGNLTLITDPKEDVVPSLKQLIEDAKHKKKRPEDDDDDNKKKKK
jgi:hypothetical protein